MALTVTYSGLSVTPRPSERIFENVFIGAKKILSIKKKRNRIQQSNLVERCFQELLIDQLNPEARLHDQTKFAIHSFVLSPVDFLESMSNLNTIKFVLSEEKRTNTQLSQLFVALPWYSLILIPLKATIGCIEPLNSSA